ncbi:MAG: phosphatidylglycerophosphatase A [candidate division WOR-3 bacterium]|nr:phosphatidylglycerophosphatase A [candidate division WOR-3 bacterium]MCX7757383.1 phosphatidylglycerophosphatase A [candidate division WOR-3 bacterium]MDW7988258.1 phosphatidylglycerophosphatase A [candidate division WOR-3 bacterium]
MTVFLSKLIATTLFSGYIPLAPGTWGSILALPLVFFLNKKSWYTYFIVLVLLFSIGFWCADRLTKHWQKKDDARINIDEFIGVLITFFLLPRINFLILVIGFILFRFFDIVKPLHIRAAENIKNNFGIMLDDIIAGIYSNLLLQFFVRVI